MQCHCYYYASGSRSLLLFAASLYQHWNAPFPLFTGPAIPVVERKAHDLGRSIRLDWYYTPAQSFLHCRQGCQEIRCNYRMPACVSPMHALHDMSILTLQASSLYSRLLFMLLKVILSQSLCHCYRCGISCYFPRRNASTLMSGFVLTSIEVASA
jgi:hypothetical protein